MQETQVQSLGLEDPLREGGHGNPLQYSCLENPRDGGAWWAAVYGATQSRTRLKRLSNSSSSSISYREKKVYKPLPYGFYSALLPPIMPLLLTPAALKFFQLLKDAELIGSLRAVALTVTTTAQ